MVDILTADSTTRLDARYRGHVLVGGSHGGLIAGYLAAKAGVRAVILQDAGVGKDGAGIAGLDYVDALGMPAATIDHMSARIADGKDQLARGIISHVNRSAAALGCARGQSTEECAERMCTAEQWLGAPPDYREARYLLRETPGLPQIWGIDSVSLVRPEDKGQVVIAGSHCALLGGKPDGIVKGPPLALALNDAGVGADQAGIARLAMLDRDRIPGVAVSSTSARIGDARSAWETGRLSHVNEHARGIGVAPGDAVPAFADKVVAAFST